jgi:hypothetical protein
MSSQSEELSAEEKKVLDEALSNGGVRIGPTPEYAADLRRRLLNAASAVQVTRAKPNRRVLVGSIFGAAVAAVVLAGLWFSNGEPAWASAIRKARGQAWIHAKIERDGVLRGQIWVSPERDIVAATLGKTVLFQDYKHEIFLRYDGDRAVLYRASRPENPNLSPDLLSASSLAAMFRRSHGAPSLLPNEPVEHWSLQNRVIDGIPCDEYEIEIRLPDGATSTLLLTVDKRLSLPRSMAITQGDFHATSVFDYPPAGPMDGQALGIPAHPQKVVDIDKSGELSPIVQTLQEGRKNFDDYTALSVTSVFGDARPLQQCNVKRVLRRGGKLRIDRVEVSDPDFVLPQDPDQALRAWRAKNKSLRYVPLIICDGRFIGRFWRTGEVATGGLPFQVSKATDDSAIEGFATEIPERSCRPIFHLGTPAGAPEREGSREELIKVNVLPLPTAKGHHDLPKTYLLDPNHGDVALRIVTNLDGPSEASASKPRSSSREVAFKDFRQSPRGYWYPGVVDRDPISNSQPVTRFYVDFANVPSDDLFGPVVPTP